MKKSTKEFFKTLEIKIHNNKVQEKPYINDVNKNEKILIECKNLKQEYGKNEKTKKIIFEGINFNIYEGDHIALMGSNGAGKTTLVEMIAGFRVPSEGQVIYHFDKDLTNNRKIGVQFQDLSFPKSLNVEDVIRFCIDLDNTTINELELEEMLQTFKLDTLLKIKISKLSGGQQQRLNILLALISKPKVLILDEFTTGLDIASKSNIKDFLKKYIKQNKITLIMISHDITVTSEMINRVILINEKQVYLDAPIEDINKIWGSFSKMSSIFIK